jgi:hypothetical protein
MKDLFDRLSKELATGVSRRNALKHFTKGVGAAIAAVILRKPASAQGKSVCVDICRAITHEGREFGECMAFSAHCPDGSCAFGFNSTGGPGANFVCLPV